MHARYDDQNGDESSAETGEKKINKFVITMLEETSTKTFDRVARGQLEKRLEP